MAYFSTEPASERRNPTGKNRVWDFSRLSNETHPANRRQPAQPRRKIRPTAMKTVSGIPYWPSRDPIGERGGKNLYGFLGNDGIGKWDRMGLYCTQTSFRWTTYPRITEVSLKWGKVSGMTVLEEIKTHWEGEAEVECCCGPSFWRSHPKRTGTLVGDLAEKADEIMLTALIPLPLNIPIPANVTEGIFELVTTAFEEGLGQIPAGSKDEADKAKSDIRGHTEKMAEQDPPPMVWKGGKAPCE